MLHAGLAKVQVSPRCRRCCSSHKSYITSCYSRLPSVAGLFATSKLQKRRKLGSRDRKQLVGAISWALQAGHTVREITQDDIEGVVNLQSKGFYEPWAVDWLDSFFLSLFAAEVRNIIKFKLKEPDQSKFRAFVAEGTSSDSTLSGVVEVSLQSSQEVTQALGAASGETYAYIACMAVDLASRRQGVAIQLLKAAEKQAQAWDQHVAALHVYKTNEIAIKVYEKAGYTPLKEDGRLRTFLGFRQRILMCKNMKP